MCGSRSCRAELTLKILDGTIHFDLSHQHPRMPLPRRNVRAPRYSCNECSRRFFSPSGLTQHRNSYHRTDARPRGTSGTSRTEQHPFLNGESTTLVVVYNFIHTTAARPCDSEGIFLPAGTPPSSAENRPRGDWAPFNSRDEFELADLLFTQTEMSRGQVDELITGDKGQCTKSVHYKDTARKWIMYWACADPVHLKYIQKFPGNFPCNFPAQEMAGTFTMS